MKRLLLALLFFAFPAFSGTSRHVVASGGVTSGAALDSATGWTLAWSFSSSNTTLQPGDTVWLHAGKYRGLFTMTKDGTSGNPIIYRNYQNQRVQLVDSTLTGILLTNYDADYTWLWGLEMYQDDSTGGDIGNVSLTNIRADSVKVINCILHDAGGNTLGIWAEGVGNEFYGNLCYYSGRYDIYGAGGCQGAYTIYSQNLYKWKRVTDNILWGPFGTFLVHIYGGGGVDSIWLRGNTIFGPNGAPSTYWYSTGKDGRADSNMSFVEPSLYGSTNWAAAVVSTHTRLTWTDNYLMSGAIELVPANLTSPTITGNKIWAQLKSFSSGDYPSNTYYGSQPTGATWRFVRPNFFEAGRANITIYNWTSASSVNVDLDNVLSIGAAYEVRDAQNFYGTPVASGTFDGDSVAIPMTSSTVATPVTHPGTRGGECATVYTPAHTSSLFGAFIVVTTGTGTIPYEGPKKRVPWKR